SPNRTTPTLSCSRLRARPVTSCGSSSISSDMQLSRPCTRAMPSASERTVPTSASSAPSVSSPSIRSRRILAISSGLISTLSSSLNLLRPPAAALHAAFGAKAPHHYLLRPPAAALCRLGDFLSQPLELAPQARVQHHVADSQHETADDALVDVA